MDLPFNLCDSCTPKPAVVELKFDSDHHDPPLFPSAGPSHPHQLFISDVATLLQRGQCPVSRHVYKAPLQTSTGPISLPSLTPGYKADGYGKHDDGN